MTESKPTRDDMLQFVATLCPELQKIYHVVDRLVIEIADTSDNDFQIAASLEQVFWDFVRDRFASRAEELGLEG